ncbi:MAG: FkbM family methyltransferase [Limisphaerales bacterium]
MEQSLESQPQGTFYSHLTEVLLRNACQLQTENTDTYRFPHRSGGHPISKWKAKLLESVQRRGFAYFRQVNLEEILTNFHSVNVHGSGLQQLHAMLSDEHSRATLVDVMAYRILGEERMKLPLNGQRYWNAIHRIENELMVQPKTISVPVLDGSLNLYSLRSSGFPICIHAHLLNILNTFLLQQYRYASHHTTVAVSPGDIVIDGGGCWGDTALYFAQLAGSHGNVYCFEFAPDNLSILKRNLEMNPLLRDRIDVIKEALWDKTGDTISFDSAGPGTTVGETAEQSCKVTTRAIDDFVEEKRLDRVDFIKMDIEGAELKALQGAADTIRKFRPKLAISLYHKLEDFACIPEFLANINVPYQFFLDHFTIHQEETVLFALPVN